MTARAIPEKTRLAQLAVSDPSASAWVSANAGSGKTYVLAQRVIRLLLRGEPPSRILCLTFTKAAAAHMANEVLKTLRGWIALEDSELDRQLELLDSVKSTPERRAVARRLFATALETPGGLKVQTIHAFCDRVLHQFPFEGRVPAGFEVLEEASEADLLKRARSLVLFEAAQNSASELGQALAYVVSVAFDRSLSEVFDEVVHARRKLKDLLEPHGLSRMKKKIAAALNLKPDETRAFIEKQISGGPNLPRSEWQGISVALQQMSGNPAARGKQLSEAAAESDLQQALALYLSVFCKQDGTMRTEGQFGAEKLRDKEPVLQRMMAERERLITLTEKLRAATALERTHALNILGRELISRYEAMKRARGALDYDDLVSKAADLLNDQASAWVNYKLDGGINHILIDEAQDTSPEQWAVIENLAKEFFAGQGAAENHVRTIFAVGDEKQSIFRFQGADPAAFEQMRKKFQRDVEAYRQKFCIGRLDLSFRSLTGIVHAIDAVFARAEAFRGLYGNADEKHTIHEAIRSEGPALVELWDAVAAPPDEDNELAWDAPLNEHGEASSPVLLAQRIAKAMKHWLRGGISINDPQTKMPRRPTAGDIIVLVRRRGPLFEAILRAIKSEGIKVAGADRLRLAEHIAVMDLATLGDALLLESDDLALACALKCPLLGLTEDELFTLAHGRDGTLAAALAKAAQTDKRMNEIFQKTDRWRKEALSLRPFDFFSRVLGRDNGRQHILAKLGHEAADALDEFLDQALAYENTETPSLQGFLVFLRRGGSQVKRDLEVESTAVRVMTVHGVKGLEAPIIVLADTTSVPESRYHPWLMPIGSDRGTLVWALSSKEDPQAVAKARESIVRMEEEEYHRLLYVALTRARDALIVCGTLNRSQEESKLPEGSWYKLIRDALASDLKEQPDAAGYGFDGKVWRWRYEQIEKIEAFAPTTEDKITEPAWLRKQIETPNRIGHEISPSLARTTKMLSSSGASPSRHQALQRGEIIHRLLQELPAISKEKRLERAINYLANFATIFSVADREKIAAESLAILDHPQLVNLFDATSRGEISILGKSAQGSPVEISGRVDRLVVTAETIVIADYKTDTAPPVRPEDAPAHYIEQLAQYRAVLSRIFPDKAMRAFLVWTAKPEIHEIPAILMDEAFRRVTSL
jgi:ATP-dependent helicase/nuclease subunit A